MVQIPYAAAEKLRGAVRPADNYPSPIFIWEPSALQETATPMHSLVSILNRKTTIQQVSCCLAHSPSSTMRPIYTYFRKMSAKAPQQPSRDQNVLPAPTDMQIS